MILRSTSPMTTRRPTTSTLGRTPPAIANKTAITEPPLDRQPFSQMHEIRGVYWSWVDGGVLLDGGIGNIASLDGLPAPKYTITNGPDTDEQ